MVIFKTYSAWDKQYILDTMLRDAVILLRPVEVKKLIEIGANINCNQFPQVMRLSYTQTVFYWDLINQGSPSNVTEHQSYRN